MNKNLIAVIVIWTSVVGLSLFWNLSTTNAYEDRLAYQTGRTLFDYVVITRKWNASHDGVYVPVSDKTQPNPHLDDPLRDIDVSPDLQLTKLNAAYMTRQLSEIAEERERVQLRISSRKPLRPANEATAWEAEALRSFDQGAKEAGVFIDNGGSRAFRYMAPLMTEASCLACHDDQGFEPGDVLGGISVTLPEVPRVPVAPVITAHLVTAAAGMLLLTVLGRKLGQAYDRLNAQAVIDALTSIPNRRYFAERLTNEYKRRRRRRGKTPLSLLMCDIDHFKTFNDQHGHVAGDHCLRHVAGIIQENMRRPADFCARYGGEEFVVVLPDTDLEGARRVAEMLRERVEDQCQIRSEAGREITMSVGVATDVSGDDAQHELVRKADTALYQAKNAGRNRVELFAA